MMALQMSNNMPLDFLPSSHSRSNSVSSSSTHSSNSRPQSSSGLRMQSGMGPSQDDFIESLISSSPPNHNLTNPALKNHLRQSHIRAARAGTSPYPRDTDSVHSSSSETDDISMFLGNHPAPDYHSIASDRAKQIFVQAWCVATWKCPRQGLYFSYRRVCDQYGIPHINTATLGKAIRLCFPTIKTRRLGVRGNSKYHYCGIRPATSAEAEWLQDYIHKSNNNAGQTSVTAQRLANDHSESSNRSEDRSDEDEDEDSEGVSSAVGSKRNSLTLGADVKGAGPIFTQDLSDKTPTAATLQNQAAQRPSGSFPLHASIRRHPTQDGGLGVQSHSPPSSNTVPYLASQQPTSVRQFPHFPSIEEAVGVNSTSPHGIAAREVWGWFQDHLDSLLESVRSFRFDQFEMHLRTFWSSLGGSHREVVHAPAIAGLMAKADAIVYDMLSPITPTSLASLRQLANKMEKILLVALESYGNTFVEPKVELGARFGHLVLRFLDIYQVTQALNTVLTNQKQLAEMRRSWQKVDFESVRNQSALVCNCRHEDLVQLLEVEFVGMLDSLTKSTEPVREVMTWADKCCERLMGSSRASHGTIRSDPAFGAFQIMKLFLDDWIAVNVLRSVALSTNSVAASVEPVMQQQFFTLSPMAGQETFNSMDVRPQHLMAHTPTTSSMLAALQNDPFPAGSLDPSSSAFNSDAYGSLSYMDTSAPQDDSLPTVHQSSLSFGDFSGSGNTFDGFSQDLGMHPSATPSSEPENDPEPVKTEQQGV
ncbi:hypothetical protein B0H13DRAFT_2039819 [Mycena leptocephala]|nr:hypothetical protein B0H13DRAFT_2039819 [Mycena leptocephala]